MAGEGALSGPDPAAIAERAARAGRLAIDTEFVSERRYQPLLCLVQAGAPAPGDPAEVEIGVFDPLADLDPEPLAHALADPRVEVLMHAGRQDVALLRRSWGTEVTNVFDTQVAAGFVGYGTQSGYADLVRSVLGVTVPRSEGFTRWDRRPLNADQIAYARADVEHLPALATALVERLEARGRLAWAHEECRALEASSDERSADSAYAALPRLGRLSGRQRAVAREIVAWRERRAREIDRPAGSLLPDHVLVEIARKAPATKADLGETRGLPERTLHREHAELLAAVERGSQAEPIAHSEERVEVQKADAPVVSVAQALVRQRCIDAGIAPELVATQADLTRLVARLRGGPDASGRPLEGWRRELVGEDLLDLLDGRIAVSVAGDGKLRVERREPDGG
jgi:ribonuclease D